jgi:hypothetical protein
MATQYLVCTGMYKPTIIKSLGNALARQCLGFRLKVSCKPLLRLRYGNVSCYANISGIVLIYFQK